MLIGLGKVGDSHLNKSLTYQMLPFGILSNFITKETDFANLRDSGDFFSLNKIILLTYTDRSQIFVSCCLILQIKN